MILTPNPLLTDKKVLGETSLKCQAHHTCNHSPHQPQYKNLRYRSTPPKCSGGVSVGENPGQVNIK